MSNTLPYRYIAIEGNIGAGKTTLATKLSNDFGGKLILERFSDNPFLPGFYREPQRYAFQLELSFLADRYQQLKEELVAGDIFSDRIISDYFFSKCGIFARVNLAGDDKNLFLRLYSIMEKMLPVPDIVVYLYHDIGNLKHNILKRGRTYEREISPDYLVSLHEGYMAYFKQHPELKVLVINVNKVNFADREADYILMKKELLKPQKTGINYIE